MFRHRKHLLTLSLSSATVLAASALLPAATPPSALVADAAMKGDLAAVRKLIAQGERVNSAQGDGMTALHWAADRGDSAMADVLLKSRADVRATTRIGHYTPLLIASRTGSASVARVLLKAGGDVNAPSEAGASPLHLAAASGNAETVTVLVEHGANVNAREPVWGQTPLIFAAAYDRADAIRVLLKHGADASVHTKLINLAEDGAREQAAARRRNEVLVSFEPEKHRDTTKAVVGIAGDSALSGRRVRTERTIAGAEAAMGAAVSPDSAPRGGRGGRPAAPVPKGPFTASQIQAAIDSGRAVLMSSSTSAGAGFTEQVDTINGGVAGYVNSVGGQGGLSALHHAAREGNIAAAVALLEGGANINDPSGVDHTTPLLCAMINGQFDVAKVLIEHSADPNIESTAGNTALYAAINTQWAPRTRFPQPQEIQNQKSSYLDLVSALLKAGANPNARIKQQFWYFSYNNCGNANCGLENIDGTTVFWRAAYALDVDAMRMLIAAGADPNIPSLKMATVGGGGRGRIGAGGGGGRGGAADSSLGGRAGAAAAGGRGQVAPPVAIDAQVDSAAKAVKPGTGVYPTHCAAGVGYGNGFAGNSHRHVPEGWMQAMKYLVEELHADVNQRDLNGYTPLHHAAARGDNEMIKYLVAKGADPKAVAANFRTTVDMANGPVQRLRPFPETIALLEKLGAKNSHRCVGC